MVRWVYCEESLYSGLVPHSGWQNEWGVGGKENFKDFYDLPEAVGWTVSGSRASVDSGWLEKTSR